jgi:hypothetical protein
MMEWYRQEKLLIRPPELSGSPQQSLLIPDQEEHDEENDEFGLRNIFVHTSKWYLLAVKSYDMGPTALLPSEGWLAVGFYRP